MDVSNLLAKCIHIIIIAILSLFFGMSNSNPLVLSPQILKTGPSRVARTSHPVTMNWFLVADIQEANEILGVGMTELMKEVWSGKVAVWIALWNRARRCR